MNKALTELKGISKICTYDSTKQTLEEMPALESHPLSFSATYFAYCYYYF